MCFLNVVYLKYNYDVYLYCSVALLSVNCCPQVKFVIMKKNNLTFPFVIVISATVEYNNKDVDESVNTSTCISKTQMKL